MPSRLPRIFRPPQDPFKYASINGIEATRVMRQRSLKKREREFEQQIFAKAEELILPRRAMTVPEQ